jgi:hypothetical protein
VLGGDHVTVVVVVGFAHVNILIDGENIELVNVSWICSHRIDFGLYVVRAPGGRSMFDVGSCEEVVYG